MLPANGIVRNMDSKASSNYTVCSCSLSPYCWIYISYRFHDHSFLFLVAGYSSAVGNFDDDNMEGMIPLFFWEFGLF